MKNLHNLFTETLSVINEDYSVLKHKDLTALAYEINEESLELLDSVKEWNETLELLTPIYNDDMFKSEYRDSVNNIENRLEDILHLVILLHKNLESRRVEHIDRDSVE